FIKVLLPVASEMHAHGDRHPLRRLYLTSTRITLALVVPLALVTGFLAADLLELWVGERYRSSAVLVVVLVSASVALTSQWPAGSVLQGIGRYGPVAVAAVVSGVVNVLLSIALVGPFGLTGVALGTLFPTVAEALVFVLPFTLRELGVAPTDLIRQVLVPVLVPVLPCGAALLTARLVVTDPSWLTVSASGSIAGALYLVGYLANPATAMERAFAGHQLRRLTGTADHGRDG
ncbi:MAG: polysaccharide biosynthesis C-terminal domain-containing protein, partial [Propionibacteriales bacterium]|nr:polysaccharide biosynthesis C-terminal domain-containing protein [Propionibacteriales bacterium]